jgi:predicted dehydrogenase
MAHKPKVGLIGPGRWGKLIVRDLVSLGSEVWAMAPSAESAANAREMGAHHVVGAIADLPELDGYVVATPEKTHLDVIEALLPRGRPIFVEKPLGVDLARARALPPVAHERVFVMHKWRYHPGIEALAGVARSGELGAARGMMLERSSWGGPQREVSPVWVLAPHDLSIALHVLGEVPRPVWAGKHPLSASGQGSIALLETRDGRTVSLNISYDVPTYRRDIVLGCADGAAQLSDPLDDHLKIARPGAGIERRPISTELPLLRELRVFLEHLEGGPAPYTRLVEEIAIIETVEQLVRMATG